MQISGTLRHVRHGIFSWRYHADLPLKLTLALGFAVITGVLAQVRLPLPFTPVPVTGQTLAVLLAAVALGRKWGGISMGIYGLLGLAGMPWFNGASSGLGATTGYIIGFAVAATLIGYLTDRYLKARSFISLFAIMLSASLVLIYVPGLVWLGVWLNFVAHKSVSIGSIFGMGALPFIAGDIMKASIAAGIAWILLPKTSFSEKETGV